MSHKKQSTRKWERALLEAYEDHRQRQVLMRPTNPFSRSESAIPLKISAMPIPATIVIGSCSASTEAIMVTTGTI